MSLFVCMICGKSKKYKLTINRPSNQIIIVVITINFASPLLNDILSHCTHLTEPLSLPQSDYTGVTKTGSSQAIANIYYGCREIVIHCHLFTVSITTPMYSDYLFFVSCSYADLCFWYVFTLFMWDALFKILLTMPLQRHKHITSLRLIPV